MIFNITFYLYIGIRTYLSLFTKIIEERNIKINKKKHNLQFLEYKAQYLKYFKFRSTKHRMKASNQPTVTSLISNGRRRLVYVYEDGRQMVQEYDMKTHDIINRKIKKPTTFKQSKWQYEIGDGFQKGTEQVLIKPSNAPIFIRKDILDSYQWRIRNLPYPVQTYLLEVDPIKQQIIIKTTNKKYYKKFDIPDLKRANVKLNKDNLSHSYKNQTLIVSYKKPEDILEKEVRLRKQFQKMNAKKPKQGDLQCSTQ